MLQCCLGGKNKLELRCCGILAGRLNMGINIFLLRQVSSRRFVFLFLLHYLNEQEINNLWFIGVSYLSKLQFGAAD